MSRILHSISEKKKLQLINKLSNIKLQILLFKWSTLSGKFRVPKPFIIDLSIIFSETSYSTSYLLAITQTESLLRYYPNIQINRIECRSSASIRRLTTRKSGKSGEVNFNIRTKMQNSDIRAVLPLSRKLQLFKLMSLSISRNTKLVREALFFFFH